MSYRVLVLPDRDVISLPVLKKIKELVAAGATRHRPKTGARRNAGKFCRHRRRSEKNRG